MDSHLPIVLIAAYVIYTLIVQVKTAYVNNKIDICRKRRRTNVVVIFSNQESYLRLVTTYLMEYAEDWSVSRAYIHPKAIQTLLLSTA